VILTQLPRTPALNCTQSPWIWSQFIHVSSLTNVAAVAALPPRWRDHTRALRLQFDNFAVIRRKSRES
jgi:hypothetical protein